MSDQEAVRQMAKDVGEIKAALLGDLTGRPGLIAQYADVIARVSSLEEARKYKERVMYAVATGGSAAVSVATNIAMNLFA